MIRINCLSSTGCELDQEQCRRSCPSAKDLVKLAGKLLGLPPGDHRLLVEGAAEQLDDGSAIPEGVEQLTLVLSQRPEGWSSWMKEVKKYPEHLQWAPKQICEDKDVILEAISV